MASHLDLLLLDFARPASGKPRAPRSV
jgi:hypothetical protein